MKNIISTMVLLFMSGLNFGFISTPNVLLKDAVDKKFIQLAIHGNSKSSHYQEPLVIDLINLQTGPVSIILSSGQLFIPDDAGYQTLISTGEMAVNLLPHQKKQIILKAMCTEENDKASGDEQTFNVGNVDKGNLGKVATFISQNNYQNYEAQQAIWDVASGDNDIDDVWGYDTTAAKNLRNYLGSLLNITVPKEPVDNPLYASYNPPTPKVSLSGKVHLELGTASKVVVGMYNSSNVIVRELYNNPTLIGAHDVKYEFDASLYSDPFYYIGLMVDGQFKIKQKVVLKS